MGTYIKLEIWTDEVKDDKQKIILDEYIKDTFKEEEIEKTDEGYILEFHTSYSCAYIEKQFDEDILNKLKGSGVTIDLYYMERDPDDSLIL